MNEQYFPHKCTIEVQAAKQHIAFQAGSATFLEGDPVIGASSGATGVIDQVVLSGGSWSAGDAEGYLVLGIDGYSISGIFQPGEPITSDHGVAMVVSQSDHKRGSQVIYYWQYDQVDVPCWFQPTIEAGALDEMGQYAKTLTRLFLGPSRTIAANTYRVVTMEPKYAGAYEVLGAKPFSGRQGVEYLDCDLRRQI